MSEIIFKPWEGPNYHKSDFKILVLGESHYAEKFNKDAMVNPTDEIRNFTNTIVNKFLDYKMGMTKFEKWMNTFTKFSNVYEGKTLDSLECQDWWNNVAFYNFIQVPMGEARKSPSIADFENSYDAFVEVCEALKPDFIIFWGYRLYNNINKKDIIPKDDIAYSSKLNFLKLPNKIHLFLTVPHPSSRHHSYSQKVNYTNYLEVWEKYKALNDK